MRQLGRAVFVAWSLENSNSKFAEELPTDYSNISQNTNIRTAPISFSISLIGNT